MLRKILSIFAVVLMISSFALAGAEDMVVFTEDFSGDVSNWKTFLNEKETDGIISVENNSLHFNAPESNVFEVYGFDLGELEANTTYVLSGKASVTNRTMIGYLCINLWGYNDAEAVNNLPKDKVNGQWLTDGTRVKLTNELEDFSLEFTTGDEAPKGTTLNFYCCTDKTNWTFIYEYYIADLKLEKKPADKLADAVTLALRKNKALVKGELKQIDPDNAEVYPKTVNNRTLVPVRFISENFGAEVGWDDATRTVSIKTATKEISMQIGSNKLVVDGNITEMDVAPAIMENRTMIPLRALCETALGKKVFWDDKGLIVVSDKDNILDSTADAKYIDEVLAKLD